MSESQNQKRSRRTLNGVVVSDKPEKTVVVRVDRTVVHPKYGKRYIVSKKYHVHDENNAFSEGDMVEFAECRPLSKQKRWRVIGGNVAKGQE